MSIAKSAFLSAFTRNDNPRRETLRTELAKAAAGKRACSPGRSWSWQVPVRGG